ncbi:MAG: sugar phosphate isomerase/epimerase family protein [Armatimonadota bacterium]
MKLGVDIFSIRSQQWNAFEHLDYCKRIGLDVVHFSDLGPFESTEDGYLKEVKAHADELALDIEAGMGSVCPTSTTFNDRDGSAVEQVARMLHVASVLGSPVLRCFLGANADRTTDEPLETHIASTVATCEAVRDVAMDLCIKLAIENHAGDMQAWELKGLIERAGPDYVGACIDSGNPLWVAEDPLVTLERLAPYVAASHIRDTAVWSHPEGAAVQWVAMGDGNVGIDEWAAQYQALCPDIPFTLEIITGGTPRVLNYMEDEYWHAYPNARASEFARFERLVRNGTPFTGHMVMVGGLADAPPEYAAAQKAQQLFDLERSVKYCRKTLGIAEQ